LRVVGLRGYGPENNNERRGDETAFPIIKPERFLKKIFKW
jgi:hypothetical protein